MYFVGLFFYNLHFRTGFIDHAKYTFSLFHCWTKRHAFPLMQGLDCLPIPTKSFIPPLPVPAFSIVLIIFTTVPMTSQLLVRVNGYVNHYGRIMRNGLVLHIGAVHSE